MSGIRKGVETNEELLTALLIDAIQHRENAGETTTLRDLHALIDTSQPVALRIAHKLEDEGSLVVERNLTDAFASTVRIAPPLANRLMRVNRARNPFSA